MKQHINLVGAGRVGQTIARRIVEAEGCVLQDVFARDGDRGRKALDFIGAGRLVTELAAMRPADLWLLTVPDDHIAGIASELAAIGGAPSLAVHSSGCLPASEMAALESAGWEIGSAHPMLSFANPALAVARFEGTLFGVEGKEAACAGINRLLAAIGGQPFQIQSGNKAIYHGAAVFSSNFAVVLQAVARESWAYAGVPDDIAAKLNAALLNASSESVIAIGPQAALTGPAARGDRAVIERQHAAYAAWDAQFGRLYAELSDVAGRLKVTGFARRQQGPQ